MGLRHWGVVLLLVAAALATTPEKATTEDNVKDDSYVGYDDYDEAVESEPILFNEDKPCPRDCICEKSQGYRIAKCNRLEIGTQKFGDDITDLIVEHLDPTLELNLEDNIFKKLGLHQVSTIKIVNTTITHISPNAFHGLVELYAVTLTGNRLSSLHPETFAHNRKLILLTLFDNPLKFPAKGSKDYFLNSTSVQELDISNCNMRYIAAETFSHARSLMYLNVAGNELTGMDDDAFRSLPDLEELDLSDNHLLDLASDLFMGNTELATLHIQRNPIETVHGLEIPDIVTLNAGQTKIKFVGPSMFNGLTYISNLNLSGNGIEKIHNQAFHKLQDLNYLDLSYNNLDLISPLLIYQNNELDIFKISNNRRLKHLPKNGFNCSAEQFNIYLFDASNCGLEDISDNALKTFPALTQIILSENELQDISDEVFAKCTRLIEVNLANNLLTVLSAKMFAQNKELSKLNLRGNPITTLPVELFTFIPKLTWLDVSENELTALWDKREEHPKSLLNNLLFLNISNNNIQEVKQTEIKSMHQLATLDVSNNPLLCSGDFEMLMTWVTKYKISSSVKDNIIANIARIAPEGENPYSWDSLVKKTCDSRVNSTKYLTVPESSESASEEEIWENVEKKEPTIQSKNFDNILEDAKEVDDDKDILAEEDVDDDKDVPTDYDGDDDDDEDSFDDNMDIHIKLLGEKKPLGFTTQRTDDEDIEIAVKVLDEAETLAVLRESAFDRYHYVWAMLVIILAALLLLVVIAKVMLLVVHRRHRRMRYNSAIVAAMSQQRTKKDCGLVYQQLSEELVGPRTPHLSRHGPLPPPVVAAPLVSRASLEASPLRSDVPPEAV